MQKVYFENIENALLTTIASAEIKIYVAVAWFTNSLLFDELNNALKRGVEVKVLLLNDILNRSEFGLDFDKLMKNGADVRFATLSMTTMHNKFCIIDNVIITGSYNWTYHANANNENIIVTDDECIVNKYQEQFELLFGKGENILPYVHLKWADIKEDDFTESRRNIYKDVVTKKDENYIIRKKKLIELDKAYKSNDREKISLASSLPIYDECMTLKDLLINNPHQYELKLWTENKCPQIVDNCLNGVLRKWIYLPYKFMNGSIEGELIPFTFIDDIGSGIDLSINNPMFLKTIKKFINLNEIDYDSYKSIPESIICIENVNMFHYQFEKPMYDINQPRKYYPSGNDRYVYGVDVLGIAKDFDGEPIVDDSIDFERYYLGYTNSLGRCKIDKERITFFDGWNPVKRGSIIQKRFFTL